MTIRSLSPEFCQRIGFGCGRLVGGASLKESAILVDTAAKLGVRYYDTAPSYGLGTADDVLGAVFSGDDYYQIATKVGISRPKSASAMAVLRKFVAPLVKRSSHLKRAAQKYIKSQSARNVVNSDALVESIEDSMFRLKRNKVHRLFFHEGVDVISQGHSLSFFQELQNAKRIEHFGQATSGTEYTQGFGDAIQISVLSNLVEVRQFYKFITVHGILRSSLGEHHHKFIEANLEQMLRIERNLQTRDLDNVAKIIMALSVDCVDKCILSFKCPEQMKRTLIVANEMFIRKTQ